MPQRTCSLSSPGIAQKDVHARQGLTQVLTADLIRNELSQRLGNMRRPVTVASANRLRAEEQTDSKALIPVAVVGPPPVAICRSAVPGGIVPGATTDHALCVPACPPVPEQLSRPADSCHRIAPFSANSRHPPSEHERKRSALGKGLNKESRKAGKLRTKPTQQAQSPLFLSSCFPYSKLATDHSQDAFDRQGHA